MSSTNQMNIQHVPNESENFYDQIQMMLLYTLVVGFMNYVCYLLTSKKQTVHERLYLGTNFFLFIWKLTIILLLITSMFFVYTNFIENKHELFFF